MPVACTVTVLVHGTNEPHSRRELRRASKRHGAVLAQGRSKHLEAKARGRIHRTTPATLCARTCNESASDCPRTLWASLTLIVHTSDGNAVPART